MSSVKWCAAGYGSGGSNATGYIAYSYDGINWTQASTGSMFIVTYSITHSGSVWVVGSHSGARLGYSYDGINWSASANGNTVFSGAVVGVAYGDGKFVAVGLGTSYSIAYSTDGINWIGCANGSFFGGSYGYCVTYKNSTWVAGAGDNGYIGYSTNGINWTAVNTGLTAVCGIDWNSTYWVIVGNNTLYSSNLTSWSGASGGGFPTVGRAIKWNGSKFISVGQDNGGSIQFKTSTNGTSWTSLYPANCTNPMMSINYNPYTSLWVIGKEGTYKIIYSTDGVTWTNSPSNLSNFITVRSVAYALPPSLNSLFISPSIPSVNYTGTYTKIPAVPINSLFYDIYTLTGNGTLTFSFSVSNVQVLIVGGGGGGGGTANTNEGGGGGGGGSVGVGYLTFTGNTNYNISVGNGGVGGAANSSTLLSTSGGNTTISGTWINETANGGGSGGNSFSQNGGNGGSGGGGNGSVRTYPGGTSTKGTGTLTYYGNAGGAGLWSGSGGGGGGASSAGVDGTKSTGGNAGSGYTWALSGSMYGGGGGGGLAGPSQITLGTGTPGSGSGGGGNGGSSFVPAVAGTANTGGGGGGGYAGTGGGSGGAGGSGVVILAVLVPNPAYPCFLQGSKILRFSHETYQDEYVPVESLRKGDLIATAESGYQPIHSIGYKTIPFPKSDPNPSNRLYKFSKKTCPTIFEPLYITGEHCTLHRHIQSEKRDLITEHMGDVYITEEYYRMPAFLDDRGESYDGEDKPATIWHFALEHENVAHNYGVFANGLLVESCAIESLIKKSGMRLLE